MLQRPGGWAHMPCGTESIRAGAMNHVICCAIANLRLLRLSYSGWNRVVEPHAYGLGRGGREVIRAWRVVDCISFDGRLGWRLDPVGWKLLRVDEIGLHRCADPSRTSSGLPARRKDALWLSFTGFEAGDLHRSSGVNFATGSVSIILLPIVN